MLHTLKPASGSRSSRKRIARGNSGKGGTTGGRGTKGQQSRTGKGRRFGFEGGQTPLLRRQPKLAGFERPRRVEYEALTLMVLERKLDAGTYTLADLRARRLLRTTKPVKLIGNSAVSKKFSLEVHAASKGAKQTLEKAGGSLTVVPMPV
jgi:large subunit ribosomal protein L15